LLKRIVSFSQSTNQSPNISPNDQHLFAKAVNQPTVPLKRLVTYKDRHILCKVTLLKDFKRKFKKVKVLIKRFDCV